MLSLFVHQLNCWANAPCSGGSLVHAAVELPHERGLFISQRLDRLEVRRAVGGVDAEE